MISLEGIEKALQDINNDGILKDYSKEFVIGKLLHNLGTNKIGYFGGYIYEVHEHRVTARRATEAEEVLYAYD